jgi:predicted dehydrogenase/threonine dehydrogenase-like Zn-dependent dehydrogenase
MVVDFARGSLIAKAQQQPERVSKALQKIQTDGLFSTVDAVRSKLDQPVALGYCNVGRVIETGADEFRVGDRVVSNGSHAEVVVVPRMLCARIPDGVDDESATFTILGSIALQGVRLAMPTLGEAFAVMGLGLIGLLSVQILRANGCNVLGIDTDPERLDLARRFGAEVVDLSRDEDPLACSARFSRGRGVDGVLVAASTKSSEPISLAARMCRHRGRIVLVGVTGLELNRSDFYEKEITFQVSCSYGPGRYDYAYEEQGHDYPIGLVRWTEQRNFEAVLDMIASGKLDARPLISHRFAIEKAANAYDVLSSKERSLGILINYAPGDLPSRLNTRIDIAPDQRRKLGQATLGCIGAGNYAGRVLLDAFKEAGAALHTIVSANGVSAAYYGRKFGFRQVGSEASTAIDDANIDAVCIATRHDSHAKFVRAALAANKHVFVEKPLCVTLEELAEIESDLKRRAHGGPLLTVGFNRRFAPMVTKAKSLLESVAEPKSFVMTVNAGSVPGDHWTQTPEMGGRILGEACHFIDLLRHLAGSPIKFFDVIKMEGLPGLTSDTAVITLRFADGSIGVLNYFANGHRAIPKERLEVYCAGRVLLLDNYRRLAAWGWQRGSGMRSWKQDKGQLGCTRAFVSALKTGGPPPIPLEEILEVSRVSIEIASLT